MGYDSCSKDFDRGSQPPPGNRGSGTGGEVVAVTSTDDAVSPGERAPKRRATLAAVAAEAGVSLPTVSKVVNGRPDVAPDTRARAERLLGEFNYHRPGSRRGQRRGRRSGLIDLIFNGLDSPWAVEILRGVEDWCASHATGAAVSAVRHGSARPASWTSALASHDTEGVILVPSELTAPQLQQLRGEGIPLVVVDPVNLPDPDLPSVGTTNWAGGLAATDHLTALGPPRIGAIAGPPEYLCNRARLDRYRSAPGRGAGAVPARADPARRLPAQRRVPARQRAAGPARAPHRDLRGQRPAGPGRLR